MRLGIRTSGAPVKGQITSCGQRVSGTRIVGVIEVIVRQNRIRAQLCMTPLQTDNGY